MDKLASRVIIDDNPYYGTITITLSRAAMQKLERYVAHDRERARESYTVEVELDNLRNEVQNHLERMSDAAVVFNAIADQHPDWVVPSDNSDLL